MKLRSSHPLLNSKDRSSVHTRNWKGYLLDDTAILASDYGEAGAVNIYGPIYYLLHPISGIDSFWLWGYGDPPPETVSVLDLALSDVDSLYKTCSITGTNANPYGIQNGETQAPPISCFAVICANPGSISEKFSLFWLSCWQPVIS
jgi:hypothetical protein